MPTEVVPYVPFLAALLGALALTVIFTTGLLLDLLGSWYFRSVEVRVFISNIRRNKRWLARVIDQNEEYIQDDWSRLLNAPPAFSKTARLVGLKVMVFWNRRYRREYVDTVRQSWALLMPYTRFQAFLLIYVLLTAGVEKIELLNTQMTLWNTSRAIAAAMAIGAIEIGITPLLYIYKPGALNFSFFIFLAVQFALTGLAFAVSHSAYARVCRGRAGRRNPARRRCVVLTRREALAWRFADHGHEPHRDS